ncbi:MAG: hypothetical protein M1836_002813 [Candelina mexicana]|nr:MAG: hypothetical protein M1836_002813 [Candelina mexicana]
MVKKFIKQEVEEMDNPERVQQLERIDQLRELGVGDEIKLPQLVVVGDQSSGKSSLLEGLTGLPFPVASELCTRFATQIVFRRSKSPEETITVSIIPAANSGEAHKQKLGKFTTTMPDLTVESFGKLLNDAAVCMGLPGVGDDVEHLEKRFSDDVLKIQISGPKQHQLSFVDVPGLFHNPTKYQTVQDSAIIRSLIESYVQDPRTIIMAVMDSRNNLANQEVFRIAKAADPAGLRTVGIMTKLDALQDGDEPAAIKIAQNQVEKLMHGWYCVRNRSTMEINAGVTIEGRHQKEKGFFRTPPWNVLDNNRVGISSLKASLGRLLSAHVAKEFPEISKEIDSQFNRLSEEHAQLGDPRQTPHEHLQFLIKLTTIYQQEVEKAMKGQYAKKGLHRSKLRMHIKSASEEFNAKMCTKGCTLAWRNTDEMYSDFETQERTRAAARAAFGQSASGNAAQRQPDSTGLNDHQTIDDVDMDSEGESDSEPDDQHIYKVISTLYNTSRGTELPGFVNPLLFETLFEQQTRNWRSIAEDYITRVINHIWACSNYVLKTIVYDKGIRINIRARVDAEMTESMAYARDELDRLLHDECTGPLTTTNHYFADNLAKFRAERIAAGLKRRGYVDGQMGQINFAQLTAVAHLSNEASAVHDIHDALKAYYKVALKRFIDNVVVQVVERSLLGSYGPLKVFTPEWVGRLKQEDLAAIAAEDFATSNSRSELTLQIARLEEARRICTGKA